jgi:hypothetical protein
VIVTGFTPAILPHQKKRRAEARRLCKLERSS